MPISKLSPPPMQLRAAFKQALTSSASELLLLEVDLALDPSGPPIVLSELLLLDDIAEGWLLEPVERLYRLLVDVYDLDFTDPKVIGKRMRTRVEAIACEVQSCLVISRFLAEFQADQQWRLAERLTSATAMPIFAAIDLVSALMSDDDQIAEARAASFDETMDRSRQFLDHILEQPSRADHAPFVVGSLADAFDDDPPITHGTRASDGMIVKAEGQLRLVCAAADVNDISRGNYCRHALRFAGHRLPLLTQRVAVLTSELVESCMVKSPNEAAEAIWAFSEHHSGAIMSAGLRIHREAEGEDAEVQSMLAAYRRLVERVFRPYATLVLALLDTNDGVASTVEAELDSLADIEMALDKREGELPELLARMIDRRLRNAIAHEEIEVDSTGTLNYSDENGILTPIDFALAEQRFWRLRAALTGVDCAVQLALSKNSAVMVPAMRAGRATDGSFRFSAANLIADYTDGVVVGFDLAANSLRIEVDDCAMPDNLLDAVVHLSKVVKPFPARVVIADVSGQTLLTANLA